MLVEQIGNATLYCGDCRDVLPKYVGGGSVQAVVTDPPYGIAYQSSYRLSGKTKPIANDTEPPLWSVPLMYDALANGGALYLCTRHDVMCDWQMAVINAGMRLKTPIIWDKGNWTMGDLTGDYSCQCEFILFAHKGRHNLLCGRKSNIWRVPRDKASEHPTPKPVALMANCIRNSTNVNDLVLDPFMGSGSTGVAAVQEGRHFIGVELEREYFDIACRRIEGALKAPQLFTDGGLNEYQ